MSAIYLDNRLVHYEVFGRGQPIIFLHSWLGSWRYWVSTMDVMSDRYRAFALDFWGFGDSDHGNGRGYSVDTYVHMLVRFMDELGIVKANLVGHGLGGMVAIAAAKSHPDRVIKLVTVSTPLMGEIMRDVYRGASSGGGGFARLLGRGKGSNVWSKVVRQLPIDDNEIQQELYEDTDRISEQVVEAVQQSVVSTNLQATLSTLNDVPMLAVYGEKDSLVPHDHATFLKEREDLPHQVVVLPRANHFPFLDDSTTFTRLLRDYLVSNGSPVEIKEQWRRRVSQREYL